MVWFNVDDGFYDHPKVKAIPRGAARKGAISLWTLAGSWNANYRNDGLIPVEQVEEFGGTAKDVEHLCRVRLWHAPGYLCFSEKCTNVPAGFVGFHDWSVYQRSREQVEHDREQARLRQSRRRSRRDTPSANEGTTPDV